MAAAVFFLSRICSNKGWDSVIATDLTGTWNLTKAVAETHSKNGGKVINITMLTDRGFLVCRVQPK